VSIRAVPLADIDQEIRQLMELIRALCPIAQFRLSYSAVGGRLREIEKLARLYAYKSFLAALPLLPLGKVEEIELGDVMRLRLTHPSLRVSLLLPFFDTESWCPEVPKMAALSIVSKIESTPVVYESRAVYRRDFEDYLKELKSRVRPVIIPKRELREEAWKRVGEIAEKLDVELVKDIYKIHEVLYTVAKQLYRQLFGGYE